MLVSVLSELKDQDDGTELSRRYKHMSTMVVFAFNDEIGAERMRDELEELQKERLVTLDDAAVVVRKQDGKVKVKHATSLVGAGALGGAFWGMLIGLLFFMPWLGLAVGALSGAVAGKLTDVGIDDEFIKEVGQKIKLGNSALFLLVREATVDRLVDRLKPFHGHIIKTSLSKEDEMKLRESFGAEAAA
jgi:uncharacterized membrane protein